MKQNDNGNSSLHTQRKAHLSTFKGMNRFQVPGADPTEKFQKSCSRVSMKWDENERAMAIAPAGSFWNSAKFIQGVTQ
jgi:hypothetical protein